MVRQALMATFRSVLHRDTEKRAGAGARGEPRYDDEISPENLAILKKVVTDEELEDCETTSGPGW